MKCVVVVTDSALWPGRDTMTIEKIKDRERDSRHPDGPESPPDAVVDELAGLLPAEALEDALKGP